MAHHHQKHKHNGSRIQDEEDEEAPDEPTETENAHHHQNHHKDKHGRSRSRHQEQQHKNIRHSYERQNASFIPSQVSNSYQRVQHGRGRHGSNENESRYRNIHENRKERHTHKRKNHHERHPEHSPESDDDEWAPLPEVHGRRGQDIKYGSESRTANSDQKNLNSSVKPNNLKPELETQTNPPAGPSKMTGTASEACTEVDRILNDPPKVFPPVKCCVGWCCEAKCTKCVAKLLGRQNDFPLSEKLQDPNEKACLFFKILALKSFQLFVAAVVTFYFQITWTFEDGRAMKPSAVVKFALDYYWTVFAALGCYIFFRIDARCQKQKVFITSFMIYLIQTGNITYICFICGLRWELVLAPVVTMTLCLVYFILALVPLMVKNGEPSTHPRTHWIGTILVLIFSAICWFLIVGFLGYNRATVALVYFSMDWLNIIFLHWVPAFFVAECFCMIDVFELRKIFQGARIRLSEKSWMFATVYL